MAATNLQPHTVDVSNYTTINGTVVLNQPEGEIPPTPISTILTVPDDGLWMTDDRKNTISASNTNNSYAIDLLISKADANNWMNADYTQWWYENISARARAIMSIYLVTGDTQYLDRAKEIFLWYYTDRKINGSKEYPHANGFRREGPIALQLYSNLRRHLTALEKEKCQTEFKIWAEYWLDHMNYQNNFDSITWVDTDHTTMLRECFLLMAINIEDFVISTKCHLTFEFLNYEVNTYLVGGVCASGIWCEGIDYNANTLQNYLRPELLMREYTDIGSNDIFIDKIWDAYKHQFFNFDDKQMFWHGDVEDIKPYSLDQNEYRYIEFYDTMFALATSDTMRAEISYCMGLLDHTQAGYYAYGLPLFFDSRITPVKPTPDTQLKASNIPFANDMIISRDSFNTSNIVSIINNHAWRVDHQHREPLAYELYDSGIPLTKAVIAYAVDPPCNSVFITNHKHATKEYWERPDNVQVSPSYLAGSAYTISQYNDTSCCFFSGDTTQTFNNVGYGGVSPMLQNTRSIYIDYDDKFMLVHDRVVTDPLVFEDMESHGATAPYSRPMYKVHRFMNNSVSPVESSGVYTQVYEGKEQRHQELLPSDTTALMNENTDAFWQGHRDNIAYQMVPEHIGYQLRSSQTSNDGEWIGLTDFGDEGVVSTSSSIVNTVTDIQIVTINSTKTFLINRNPNNSLTSISVNIPTTTTELIVMGLAEGDYILTTDGSGLVTLVSGTGVSANEEQFLRTGVTF